MLRQYYQHKAEHPGVLMAIRIGDFYEFYGDDAVTAAEVLEITLTGREDGSNGRIPMAGVPFHSVEKYLARLVQAGHKVAICDQVEDPKAAKGLVRRAVTRVMTPGTLVEESMLSAGQNNFLAAICVINGRAGLATLDVSTGEFLVTEFEGENIQERLLQELARIRPAELLNDPTTQPLAETLNRGIGAATTEREAPNPSRAARDLMRQFQVDSLAGYGCADKPSAVAAASMILSYAEQNRLDLGHVETIAAYSGDANVAIDPNTLRSLELTQNLSDGGRKYTLLEVLDETVTPMGSRLLRRWIERPLLDLSPIRERHEAVGRWTESGIRRGDLRDVLKGIADLERLVSRCATGLASPRDLVVLGRSLLRIPDLKEACLEVGFGRIHALIQNLGDHRMLGALLQAALIPDPPLTLREGGVIADGHHPELDALRQMARSGREYIARLEAKEKETTGITGLKVGYNSVFGYFLEVPKRDIERVPETYIRKQTTANAERYITAELKDQESAVLGAKDKAVALESEIFHQLRLKVSAESGPILQTARAVAEIDCLSALAEVAVRRNYCAPVMVEEDLFEVAQGRHPVVEANGAMFVPNDTSLSPESTRCMILTGPNMSGKSTYLRQNALIALMAQMGSFVPADSARLGICDAVFARIGAKDELALGQSTFMVEMLESAYILNHAGPRSLVVLDEVGRGTSTYDGLAIAWAMIERLAELRAKTLFATHYHQLNVLAEQIPTIRNFQVSVTEVGDRVVWTHRVVPGGTDRSYGIHVARAAGMPSGVLARAGEILADLETREDRHKIRVAERKTLQLTLFEVEEPQVVRELRDLNVEQLTPLQALQWLDTWRTKLESPTGG